MFRSPQSEASYYFYYSFITERLPGFKIAVRSAHCCCTVTTMALTSITQKDSDKPFVRHQVHVMNILLQIEKIGRNTWRAPKNRLFQKLPFSRADQQAADFISSQPAAVANVDCWKCSRKDLSTSSDCCSQRCQSVESITGSVHGMLDLEV